MMEHKSKRTILVVEDDTDIRESVVEYLDIMGFKMLGASNGQEALDYLKSNNEQPDIILLDLMMPIMDGFAFREAQLKDTRLAQIPVLIMSADGNVQEKKSRVGAMGYLKKPVDLDDLISEIERCTE